MNFYRYLDSHYLICSYNFLKINFIHKITGHWLYNWKKKKQLWDFYELHWTQRVCTSRTAQLRHVTLFAFGAIDSLCSQWGVSWLTGALDGTFPHWWATVELPSGVGSVEKLRVLQLVVFDAGLKAEAFAPKCLKLSQGERLPTLHPPPQCSPHADGAEGTSPERWVTLL